MSTRLKKQAASTIAVILIAGVMTGCDPSGQAIEKGDPGSSGGVQETCPVMGAPIRSNLYADVEGYRIYVCCGGCIAAIESDPEKYITLLRDQGVELERTDREGHDRHHSH